MNSYPIYTLYVSSEYERLDRLNAAPTTDAPATPQLIERGRIAAGSALIQIGEWLRPQSATATENSVPYACK